MAIDGSSNNNVGLLHCNPLMDSDCLSHNITSSLIFYPVNWGGLSAASLFSFTFVSIYHTISRYHSSRGIYWKQVFSLCHHYKRCTW